MSFDAATGAERWWNGIAGRAQWLNVDVALGVSPTVPEGTRLFVHGASHDGSEFQLATVAYDVR